MSWLLRTGLRPMSGVLSWMEPIQVMSCRHNVRWHFEKPNEVKRIRTHGWLKRISTPKGRQIIMRRILKGKQVLSH
ncbi:unnamed protein product [Medioppia subpectinata]|uniref:Large ribosomal subunit protein bL34m n=1 Tax=Medioppia subpectinata TaxID=1979941 RepID=A0A7R9PZU2_9ACAR|nr:unnamed protein product [Medioppia subpectinata]CAG2106823.1 unnamed protein product [Medioppia subpectinata]